MREAHNAGGLQAYNAGGLQAYNAGGLQCGRPYAGGVSKSRAHFWSQERRDSRMFSRRMLQVLHGVWLPCYQGEVRIQGKKRYIDVTRFPSQS